MQTAVIPCGPGHPGAPVNVDPWKILVVDREASPNAVRREPLKDIMFAGRAVEVITVGSVAEARHILQNLDRIAVALIDVVMETNTAGLELVEFIRNELGDPHLYIIIRTGHADETPADSILEFYNVDDYRTRDELTPQKLHHKIRTALKSYHSITTSERDRRNLENILSSSPKLDLAKSGCIHTFCQGILEQVAMLCSSSHDRADDDICGLLCTIDNTGKTTVCARLGRYSEEDEATDQWIATCIDIIRGADHDLPDHALLLPLGTPSDETTGFIYLEHTSLVTEHDLHLIEILCNRTNSALENLRLHEHLKQANRETLYMLAQAADFKDKHTSDHIQRMASQTRKLALELGLPEEEAEAIGEASILHDIGKIGIPDAILQKEGPLSPDEYAVMRDHPLIGGRILANHPGFKLALDIALHHHERWDGGGYPYGIAGTDIPLPARIVAVVDVFDALSHQRPYKEAWDRDACIDALLDGAGSQFDPAVVKAFINLLNRNGDAFLQPEPDPPLSLQSTDH